LSIFSISLQVTVEGASLHSKSVLSLSNVSKSFSEIKALDGISLELETGISGLIGPNGAGKTTLMKIVLGLLHPDSGTGNVFGYDIAKDSLKIRRKLGVLHERPRFPKRMTPFSYLECVRRIYGSDTDSKKLLSLVDLSSASHRSIGNLSAGMHQRLGIAQALIGSPELVILDEPTANIDVAGRDMILQLILDIYNEQGVSFIVSSHILSELEKVCHNVAFIRQGNIVEVGTVQGIITKHTTNRFRIITSHPKEILERIISNPLITSPVISGANSVSITIEPSTINEVKFVVEQIAEELNVTLYDITVSDELEQAYKEIMDHAK